MNDEIMQDQPSDLSPEDAKASLGLSTRLSEEFLMSQIPPQEAEMGEGGEMMTEGEESPESEPQPDMNEIMASMREDIMKEVQNMVKEEIGGLKDEIKSALDEE